MGRVVWTAFVRRAAGERCSALAGLVVTVPTPFLKTDRASGALTLGCLWFGTGVGVGA